jgi:leucyl aminopeptidase (aminopeptidase T)
MRGKEPVKHLAAHADRDPSLGPFHHALILSDPLKDDSCEVGNGRCILLAPSNLAKHTPYGKLSIGVSSPPEWYDCGAAYMLYDASLQRAASNIIGRCFGLRRDQHLLIFADPGSLEAATLIADTAREAAVQASIFFVPYHFQSHFEADDSLPLPMEAAVRETDAVLSCLSDRAEHLAYRRRVLHTSWSRRIKMAHAPGMTLDVLRMADTDFDRIRQRCHVLATALALGREAEILTEDAHGRERRLLVEIAGWDFTPAIGDGIIPDGAWANLPPGETYIVPLSAEGDIVINGSVPGRVLLPHEELTLSFQQGRLTDMQPEDGTAARYLAETQIAQAERMGDPNWTNLAELGFGVNPAVKSLTGIGLVDEKKDGTIHIALGDSTSLGGQVDSAIHCDVVVEKPTVLVDGTPLLVRGWWQVETQDWLPDHRKTTLSPGWWERVRLVRRSGVRAERLGDQLVRQWNAGPGRWDQTPVGCEVTARLAARLYQLVPTRRETIPRQVLVQKASQLDLDEPTVAALLWIMQQYDLVRLVEADHEHG